MIRFTQLAQCISCSSFIVFIVSGIDYTFGEGGMTSQWLMLGSTFSTILPLGFMIYERGHRSSSEEEPLVSPQPPSLLAQVNALPPGSVREMHPIPSNISPQSDGAYYPSPRK